MSLSALQGYIPEGHFNEIKKLHNRILGHRSKHLEREEFYEGSNRLRDLGISLPPHMRDLEVSMDWPQKAINSVSDRLILEGFSSTEDTSELGVDRIINDNSLEVEAASIHASTLLHGVSFLATFSGDPELGEPPVIIRPFPATMATGTLQANARRLSSALLILEEDNISPTRLFFATRDELYNLQYTDGVWRVDAQENPLNAVPVVPMSFNPSAKQPFGKSRLTQPMLNYTDSAMRTLARLEVSAEMFSVPQKYILGADEEDFLTEGPDGELVPTDKWKLTMGTLLGLSYNEESDSNPEVGQFQAASPTPHTEVLKTYAQLFSAAASLPPTALGVVTDNPTSAESVRAQLEDLLVVCRNASLTFGHAWESIMKLALALMHELPATDLPEEIQSLKARFADPATPSMSSVSDAVMKLISVGVLSAESEVVLEKLGFSESDILRVKTERTRAQAPSALAEVLQGRQAPDSDTSAQDEAAVLKTKADALGLLRRAGVEAESAAELVGLTGVKFIPGDPITIRANEG